MEESRSIQHSDFDSLRSTPPLRSKDIHIPKPGKPPASDHVKTRAAIPQRQSSDGSPHYMKSTSSFDARRERSQVSLCQNSGSDHKPVGAVARKSSLKVVRALIKTPSFKPVRALTKKYQDFDVLKPTCSSTLKDSNMTMFLELSAGATESEGTSAMKVCPYTYCSLNAHHHDPRPPLKSFLSEKRRMLKAQKVIQLGGLSPRRAKPSGERLVKNEKQVILDDDTAEGKIPECLSSTAPGFVIDFEGNREAKKDQNVESGAKIHPFPKTQEDEILDRLSTQCNTDEEILLISQHGQSGSEASEMVLKERHHNEPSLDDALDLKVKVTDIYNGSNIESISNSYDNSNKIPGANDEIPKMNFELGSDAIKCTSDAEEVVFNLLRDEAAKQEHASWLLYQDSIEQYQDETHKNYNTNFSSMVVFELDSTSESRSSDDVLDKSFSAKTEYEDADQEGHEGKISTTDARAGMEEEKPLASESLDGIQTSDSLREIEQEKPRTNATEGMERKEKLPKRIPKRIPVDKLLEAQHLLGSQPFELIQELPKRIPVNKDQSKQTDVTVVCETKQSYADETLLYESNGVESDKYPEINQDQLHTNYECKSSKNSEDQMHSGPAVLNATPNQNQEADTGEGESRTEPDAAETRIPAKASPVTQKRDHLSNANSTSNEEMTLIAKLSWTTGRKNVAELEDIRDFNPREPNYLPAEPDLATEKVDLRHQLMDDRKNSEEWMVDYALRQAVTNLAPKRRKKVSLLVEAFEKVLPAPKYETRPSHTSSAFINARTTQTCR